MCDGRKSPKCPYDSQAAGCVGCAPQANTELSANSSRGCHQWKCMLHIRSSLVRNADYGCGHLVPFHFADGAGLKTGIKTRVASQMAAMKAAGSLEPPSRCHVLSLFLSLPLFLFSGLLFKLLFVWLTLVKLAYEHFSISM